jgi:hypothetical protein
MDEELRMATSKLLLSCINLTRIKGDRKTLSVIVKLYWDNGSIRGTVGEEIMGQDLSFWSSSARREVIVSRAPELEDAALRLDLILPSTSWKSMLSRLQHVCNSKKLLKLIKFAVAVDRY